MPECPAQPRLSQPATPDRAPSPRQIPARPAPDPRAARAHPDTDSHTNPPPPLRSTTDIDLLLTRLARGESLSDCSLLHYIPLHILRPWVEHPETQRRIQRIRDAEALRATHQAEYAMHNSAEICRLIRQLKFAPRAAPVSEQLCAMENAFKAAVAILYPRLSLPRSFRLPRRRPPAPPRPPVPARFTPASRPGAPTHADASYRRVPQPAGARLAAPAPHQPHTTRTNDNHTHAQSEPPRDARNQPHIDAPHNAPDPASSNLATETHPTKEPEISGAPGAPSEQRRELTGSSGSAGPEGHALIATGQPATAGAARGTRRPNHGRPSGASAVTARPRLARPTRQRSATLSARSSRPRSAPARPP